MWIPANPNPGHKHVPDCMIRAVCIALNLPWVKVHRDLCELSAKEFSVPNDDDVWGRYLYQLGFEPFLVEDNCKKCVTVRAFSEIYNQGIYIIGTGNHAVAVVDGDYYDSWDSGEERPSFFWRIA